MDRSEYPARQSRAHARSRPYLRLPENSFDRPSPGRINPRNDMENFHLLRRPTLKNTLFIIHFALRQRNSKHGDVYVKRNIQSRSTKIQAHFQYPWTELDCTTWLFPGHPILHIRSPFATGAPCSRLRRSGLRFPSRSNAYALVERNVKLALGASVYNPADPKGRMFFNILATFAVFEADLIRTRTREGMPAWS